MRIVLFVSVCVIYSASGFVEVQKNYHDAVGIPLGKSIKAQEDAILANDRIVGGVTSPVNGHPYLAGLIVRFHNGDIGACGSSILTANRLVTAAHCWRDENRQAWQVEVVMGSTLLFYGGTRVLTSNVVVHPQWTPNLLRNDIAIINLPYNVAFTTSIQPIALPSGTDLFDSFAGQWAVAAGYGKTNDAQLGVSQNTVVSHVSLQVITTPLCQATFGINFVTASNICTGGWGGIGVCGGDSGGPLYVIRNGRPVLVGVSSFVAGTGCQLGHPSAFTRITSFYNFILQHL